MGVEQEIKSYLGLRETCGALLISGRWGCGKSYIIHHLADSLNAEDQYAVASISLFGVQCIEELDKKVKEAILYVRTLNKSESDSSGRVSALIKNAKKLSSELSDVWQGFKGINAALSINLYDFFDVKSELLCFSKNGKTMVSKKLVLVFDDFERSKQDRTTLLGTINDYCENKKIKTILIADESHIGEDEYKEFKEKVISHTIKLAANYSEIIQCVVQDYKETATGYCVFLENHQETIKEIFRESKSDNLRTLKIWLTDFERVYELWQELELPANDMDQVFYNFGAVMFEYKSAQCELDQYGLVQFKSKASTHKGNDIQPERTSDKYKRLSRYRGFTILEKWIVSGEWNEEAVKVALVAPYKKVPIKDEYYFIQSDFWSLTEENINKYLPLTLDLAYGGSLTGDEIIELIQRLKDLKAMNVRFSAEVDYIKIYEGLVLREEKIESGEIIEPKRWRFIEKVDELSPEAKNVYNELDRLKNKKTDVIARKAYVEYLESPQITFENHYVGQLPVFDDGLYDLFVQKLSEDDNYRRMNLIDSLKAYLTELTRQPNIEETFKTMNNLERLDRWVNNQYRCENDGLRKYTYKTAAEKLSALIDTLKITYGIS